MCTCDFGLFSGVLVKMSHLEQIQRALLGDQLYQQCSSSEGVVSVHQLRERAHQAKMYPFQLLHACQLHHISFVTGDHKVSSPVSVSSPDQYTNLKKIGQGAFGEVYLADDSVTGQTVAIKTYKGGIDYNEIDILRRFRHPNVMHSTDLYFAASNQLHVVMPAAAGDFQAFYEQSPDVLDPSNDVVRLRYIHELLQGMVFFQSQGYCHCDLKPANVFVFKQDSKQAFTFKDSRLVIGDMSLAKPYIYGEDAHCGTPHYAAFERRLPYLFRTAEKYGQLELLRQEVEQYKAAFKQPSDVLSSDMFLVGNMIFFIITGDMIHKTAHKLSSFEEYWNMIKQHIDNPEKYIRDKLAPFPAFQQYAGVLAMLMHPDATQRPTEYVEVLSMFGATQLVTGYAEYEWLVGDLAFDHDDRVQLRSAVKRIMKHYRNTLYYSVKPYKYELMFCAIQMLYRFWSKRHLVRYPQNDVSAKCTMRVAASACIELTAALNNVSHFVYWCDCHIKPSLTEMIEETKRSILVGLKGQLRYPYLAEMVSSKQQWIEVLSTASTNPVKFVEMLKDVSVVRQVDAVADASPREYVRRLAALYPTFAELSTLSAWSTKDEAALDEWKEERKTVKKEHTVESFLTFLGDTVERLENEKRLRVDIKQVCQTVVTRLLDRLEYELHHHPDDKTVVYKVLCNTAIELVGEGEEMYAGVTSTRDLLKNTQQSVKIPDAGVFLSSVRRNFQKVYQGDDRGYKDWVLKLLVLAYVQCTTVQPTDEHEWGRLMGLLKAWWV